MTLTHAQIKTEVQELKQLLAEDKIEIPRFWQCYGPGAGLMLFSGLWSAVLIIIGGGETAVMITPLCIFFAFVITAITGNHLATYYSIPQDFRNKSKVVQLIGRKIRIASIAYSFIVCVGCSFSFLYGEPMLFSPALLGGYLIVMMVVSMDLSRYQLSAFMSVLHAVKNDKGDSVSLSH
jgi:hypothetical protein